ncbi:MAG: S-methyl-5-thioribose-1-phosphate isomerase [Deinococcales bacterium]
MRAVPLRFDEKDRVLWVLDQRRLPQEEVWDAVRDASQAAEAIRSMRVRGAPAIAMAAAYGMVLAHLGGEDPEKADAALRVSRPTAVNLSYALDKIRPAWHDTGKVLVLAAEVRAEIEATDRAIDLSGASVLRGQVLTHCNTGALATGAYGTALGAIIEAYEQGRVSHVWVDETRPYLQGARLTSYELQAASVPATLITDSMAATFMAKGEVDAIMVGVDRMALNGDFANKIGTYSLAVLAHHHGIPFYPALPLSSVDPHLATGDGIPIEERSPDEVTQFRGQSIAPVGFPARHPAFDVTPHHLVTGIVTEKGVLYPPFEERLRQAVAPAPEPA